MGDCFSFLGFLPCLFLPSDAALETFFGVMFMHDEPNRCSVVVQVIDSAYVHYLSIRINLHKNSQSMRL